MKIIFYGGKQAGMVALLSLLALKENIVCVIPVDDIVEKTGRAFKLNIKKTKDINNAKFVRYLKSLNPNLLICCHGRQILRKGILSIASINLHPCLYKYKGSHPVERLLKDKNKKASVGAHWMSEKIDEGKIITEEFVSTKGRTPIEIYNELYLLYIKVIIKTINRGKKNKKKRNGERKTKKSNI
jgi:methionyl-tRNA formyltransferase